MKPVARSVVSILQQEIPGEVEQSITSHGSMRSGRETPEKLLINFIPSCRWLKIADLVHQTYAPAISNYVFAILKCESMVLDIVRDTFHAFGEEGRTLDVEQYQRWLYRTARYKAMACKRGLSSSVMS